MVAKWEYCGRAAIEIRVKGPQQRKILNRAKPNQLQEELYGMINSEKYEIQLSKCLLWQKIQMEIPVESGGR